VPVGTHIKGRRLERYQRMQTGDIEVLIAPALPQWASRIDVDAGRFLFWQRFDVEAQHRHQPT
jgi:hypothetical protein